MLISLIVAVSENGIIGRGGALPWRLSNDLRYFKATTIGKPVIMGRRTYESIGRALPRRTNIVVTRNRHFDPPDARACPSVGEAVTLGAREAAKSGAEEVVVIGGAEIYAAALPHVGRIYLTEVHADIDGDTAFPALDAAVWREVSRERHEAGPRDDFDHSFVVLDRVTSP